MVSNAASGLPRPQAIRWCLEPLRALDRAWHGATTGIKGSIRSHNSSDTNSLAICAPSSRSKWTRHFFDAYGWSLHFVRRSFPMRLD